MKILMVACMAAALFGSQADARQTILQPRSYVQREEKKVAISEENRIPYDQFVLNFEDLLNNDSPKEYLKQYIDEQQTKLPKEVISQAIKELTDLNSKKRQLTAEALSANIKFLHDHSANLNEDERNKLHKIEAAIGGHHSVRKPHYAPWLSPSHRQPQAFAPSAEPLGSDLDTWTPPSPLPPSRGLDLVAPLNRKKHKSQFGGVDGDSTESFEKRKMHSEDLTENNSMTDARKYAKKINKMEADLDRADKRRAKSTKKDDANTKVRDPVSKIDDDLDKEDTDASNSLRDAVNFHKNAESADEAETKKDVAVGEKVFKERNGKKPIDASDVGEAVGKVKAAAKLEDDEASEKDKTSVKDISDALSKEKEAKTAEDDATKAEKKGDKGTAVLKKKEALTKKGTSIEAKKSATKEVEDAAESKVSAVKKKKTSKILEQDMDKDDEEGKVKSAEKEDDKEKEKSSIDDEAEDVKDQKKK